MMDSKIYQKEAHRTEPTNLTEVIKRLQDPLFLSRLNSSMRFVTSVGEYEDKLKKKLFYGKGMPDSATPMDDVHSGDNLVPDPAKLTDTKSIRLLHASMGLVTEAAEFEQAMLGFLFQGKGLDEVNLKEEVGDLLFYMAIVLNTLDSSFEEVMQTNIDKLRKRYPGKFSESNAVNRDVAAERKILEGGT